MQSAQSILQNLYRISTKMSTARSQNVESSYWIQVRRKSVWLLAGRVVAVSCMLLDCRLTIEWFLVLCCSVPCACARGDVWQIYFYQSRVSCWCNLDVTAVTSCPASCLHQLITNVHVCVSLPYGTTALHLALSCPVISISRQLYLKPVIHISVGLTLKRAPRSYRMTPLDRNIDFLLVFYSNYGRISYRFCATVDYMEKWPCWATVTSKWQWRSTRIISKMKLSWDWAKTYNTVGKYFM